MRASIRLCLLLVMLGAWGSTAGCGFLIRIGAESASSCRFRRAGPGSNLVAPIRSRNSSASVLGQKIDLEHVRLRPNGHPSASYRRGQGLHTDGLYTLLLRGVEPRTADPIRGTYGKPAFSIPKRPVAPILAPGLPAHARPGQQPAALPVDSCRGS